jgi:hypothetical protein
VSVIGIAMKVELINYIIEEIELKRSQMNDLSEQFGLEHPEVMKVSLQLDELLLSYYKLAKNNN